MTPDKTQSDVNLFAVALLLWSRKGIIAAGTVLVTCIGVGYALVAKSMYYSESIIALKETQQGNSSASLLGQLGGFGGFVSGQIGLGNTSLDRLEIVVRSRELAEEVVRRNDLLRRLFPKGDPKGKPIEVRDAVEMIRETMLSVSADGKKKILVMGVTAADSTLAYQMVSYYLRALTEKIQRDVKADADSNRAFLERQLGATFDPAFKEKISGLMAVELEKSMLVSSKSFDVLEKPVVAKYRARPKRRVIVMFSLAFGFLVSALGVLAWPALLRTREEYLLKSGARA